MLRYPWMEEGRSSCATRKGKALSSLAPSILTGVNDDRKLRRTLILSFVLWICKKEVESG